jgi:hypothetical protein
MTLLQAWFWPDVSSRKNALHAINEAFWVTIAVATYWTLFALTGIGRDSHSEFDLFILVDPVLLGAAAVGIRYKSRVAAILSFGIYSGVHVLTLLQTGRIGLFLSVMVFLALLHGVRGTIAFHRFAPIPEGTPSIEKSFQAFGSKRAESETDRKQD